MNVKCEREIEQDDKVKRSFECLRAHRFDRCDLKYCFLIFVFYLINKCGFHSEPLLNGLLESGHIILVSYKAFLYFSIFSKRHAIFIITKN